MAAWWNNRYGVHVHQMDTTVPVQVRPHSMVGNKAGDIMTHNCLVSFPAPGFGLPQPKAEELPYGSPIGHVPTLDAGSSELLSRLLDITGGCF